VKGVVGYSRERGLIAVRLAKAEAVVKNPSWAAGSRVVIGVARVTRNDSLKAHGRQDM
jgi:hypothetical protein